MGKKELPSIFEHKRMVSSMLNIELSCNMKMQEIVADAEIFFRFLLNFRDTNHRVSENELELDCVTKTKQGIKDVVRYNENTRKFSIQKEIGGTFKDLAQMKKADIFEVFIGILNFYWVVLDESLKY